MELKHGRQTRTPTGGGTHTPAGIKERKASIHQRHQPGAVGWRRLGRVRNPEPPGARFSICSASSSTERKKQISRSLTLPLQLCLVSSRLRAAPDYYARVRPGARVCPCACPPKVISAHVHKLKSSRQMKSTQVISPPPGDVMGSILPTGGSRALPDPALHYASPSHSAAFSLFRLCSSTERQRRTGQPRVLGLIE